MKIFTRVLALLLALLMCAAVFAACDDGSDGDGGEEEVIQTERGGVYDATKDENGRLLDDLPDNLDFGGEDVTTLYWSDCASIEFESDTITGDNVADAVYDRNIRIMDRLNVNMKWASTPGSSSARSAFVKKVESVYTGGTQDYDLIAAYSRTEGSLAVQGYLMDMRSIEKSYMNFDQTWWPRQLVETVDINGATYFISGDCSTSLLYQMNTIFYNKTMFNQYYNTEARNKGFESGANMLYDYVYNGTWTIDKLIEYSSGIYEDRNKSGTADSEDLYGFSSVYFMLESFYVGSNMRYIRHDDEKILRISPDFGSRKTVLLIEKLGNWFAEGETWVMPGPNMGFTGPFAKGRSLFLQSRTITAEDSLLTAPFRYGLVPTPKYDEKQANYYTYLGNPFTLYGIFSDCKERDGNLQNTYTMLSAVLECWCSEGYRLTTPEIFEVNMQLKYSETDDESTMFEYNRAGIIFDCGTIFANELNIMTELPSNVAVAGGSWSVAYGAYKRSLNAKLATIVDTFKRYQGIA